MKYKKKYQKYKFKYFSLLGGVNDQCNIECDENCPGGRPPCFIDLFDFNCYPKNQMKKLSDNCYYRYNIVKDRPRGSVLTHTKTWNQQDENKMRDLKSYKYKKSTPVDSPNLDTFFHDEDVIDIVPDELFNTIMDTLLILDQMNANKVFLVTSEFINEVRSFFIINRTNENEEEVNWIETYITNNPNEASPIFLKKVVEFYYEYGSNEEIDQKIYNVNQVISNYD